MRHSFLYRTYEAVINRMILILLLLCLIIGIMAYRSSTAYMEHFDVIASESIEMGLSARAKTNETMLRHWSNNEIWENYAKNGQAEPVDHFLEDRFADQDLQDPVMLYYDKKELLYQYGDLKGDGVGESLEEKSRQGKDSWYQWEDGTLWAFSQAKAGETKLFLAYPVIEANLSFLQQHWADESIDTIDVTGEPIVANRDLFHWQTFKRAYSIAPSVSAYLNVSYTLNDLSRYFYVGNFIILFFMCLIYVFVRHQFFQQAFVPAKEAIGQLESQVEKIALGDYQHRIQPSGYEEFQGLENEINGLTMAIQLRNDQLEQDVIEVYALLIKLLEYKDPYTKGHSERVAGYSRAIALKLGLGKADNIHSAGLLHDIGKVGVAGSILRKPGALTGDEYDEVKRHAEIGVEMLSNYSQFQTILDGVKFHHERMDGSGYPKGLVGNQIPMAARIIAVADVYDALTSDRSYRDAMTPDKALEIIVHGRGSLYDQAVVDAMIWCLGKEETQVLAT